MKEFMNNFSDLNLTNDEIDKAIKMADTDGDGKISFEEYKATLTKKGISYYTKSLVKTNLFYANFTNMPRDFPFLI
jgi:hypothetical protein